VRKAAKPVARKSRVSQKAIAKTVKKVAPTKAIKKQVRTLRRAVKEEGRKASTAQKRVASVSKRTKATAKRVSRVSKRTTATAQKVDRVAKRTTKLDAELAKLRESLATQKKTVRSKKQLNEYNLFMRRQLNEGKTFTQSVNLWKRLKQVESGAVPTKTRTKTVTKTVVKKVKAKPIVRYKTRVQKVVEEKPVVQYKTRVEKVTVTDPAQAAQIKRLETEAEKLRIAKESQAESIQQSHEIELLNLQKKADAQMLAQQKEYEQKIAKLHAEMVALESVSTSDSTQTVRVVRHPGAEQVPHYVLSTFFGEISHAGFKRNLSLDDVISAYFYSVAKVSQRLGKPVLSTMSNEEAAHHILHLYFREVASHRVKRRMDIDEVLDAYFYVLDKMQNSSVLIKRAESQLLEQKTVTTVTAKPVVTTTTVETTSTK
jgi:hypothetical protein